VLDGVEQAERNVLPTLNNLLENREMNLEDGRMLLLQSKIDAITTGIDSSLVAVHPNFRVVALGLPVPPFAGRTLDPPLRSRFQSRFVDEPLAETVVEIVSSAFPKGVNDEHLGKLLSFYESMRTLRRDTILSGRTGGMGGASMHSVPIFSLDAFRAVARHLQLPAAGEGGKAVQQECLAALVERVCPSTGWMAQAATDPVIKLAVAEASQRLVTKTTENTTEGDSKWGLSFFGFSSGSGSTSNATSRDGNASRLLPSQLELLSPMIAVANSGTRHFCLFGARGSGKSRIVSEFAAQTGTSLRSFPMYQELASRDLLQRRVTVSDSSSDTLQSSSSSSSSSSSDVDAAASEMSYTSWADSPLVTAARNGFICVLDGVDRLDAHCLLPLKRLLHDGVLDLPSGELLQAHANFHLVMLAEPPVMGTAASRDAQMRYISSDLSVQYLFLKEFSVLDSLPQLLKDYNGRNARVKSSGAGSEMVERILVGGKIGTSPVERSFAPIRAVLQDLENSGVPELRLTLRRANRIIDRLSAECAVNVNDVDGHSHAGSARSLIEQIYNAQLLSGKATATFAQVLDKALGRPTSKANESKVTGKRKGKEDISAAPLVDASLDRSVELQSDGEYLRIGSVSAKKNVPAFPEKVPQTLFFPNDSQLLSMQKLLRDYVRKERAVLIIGNQGVGKNKIVDKFLEFMRLEREVSPNSLTKS
jgi:MoxR-like ATPase